MHDYLRDPAWSTLFAKPEQAEDLDWGRRQLRFTAAADARSLASRELVERWLVFGNLRYPQLNISYAGEAAPPATFTRPRRLNQHQLPGCAHADDVLDHLRAGATLTLSNPEQWDERTAAFCRELGRALAASVQSYVYLTAPGQFGSRPHRDEGDVFAVQIDGTKEWTLYGMPVEDDWRRGHLDENPAVEERVVLEPGDALYVPAGMGHRAQAGPRGSLHLTISVGLPRLNAVIDALAAMAATRFGRHERCTPGPHGRTDQVRDAVRRIIAAAEAADPDELTAGIVPSSLWPDAVRPLDWS